MFEGFEKVDFLEALKRWEIFNKKIKCVYKECVYEFNTNFLYKKSFKLNGDLVMEGEWFSEYK